MPSILWLRRPVSADNHRAENSDHRDCAAAEARLRAAIPATTATETARPMVPGGLGGERQLLRAGLRQGAASRSQKRLVPVRLARERQLLHPLMQAVWHHRNFQMIANPAEVWSRSRGDYSRATRFWQRQTNVWRRVTSPARGAKRPRSVNGWLMALSTPTNPVT